MKIRYVRWATSEELSEKDCFYLEDRNWNDFGYNTTFVLYYMDNSKEIIEIGPVKILNIDNKDTGRILLKNKYIILDENFISLGQNYEYYENIFKVPNFNGEKILEKLRDWSSYTDDKRVVFKSLKGFRDSILRDWIASSIIENVDDFIKNFTLERELNSKYIYKTQIGGSENECEIDIDFSSHGDLPYRNFVIVGKNGVGKTSLLTKLAEDLNARKELAFSEKIPEYKKILMFYYGKDLEFEIDETSKLKKINIKEKILQNLGEKLNKLKEKKRISYFETAMRELLGEYVLNEELMPTEELSSGHSVIYKLMLHLLLNIETNSLVIIDELEVHLHPNIAGKVMTILRRVMEDYKAYSIISTHSPLILQQVPNRSIRLVERKPEYTKIKKVKFESFGANLTEISQVYFNINDEEADYKVILKEMKRKLKTLGIEENKVEDRKKAIRVMFDNKLTDNAELYLEILFDKE
ncbi:MAG: AAA family ATPase [Cetobacterium sp.]